MSTEKASRRLSTHQQAVLIQVLLTFPDEPVGVCYLPDVPDAHAYAEDFLTIFKAINWRVDEAKPAADLVVAPGGLALVVNEGQLPSSAEALRDALRIYGIEAEIVADTANLCGSRKFVLAVT
jgi:hypothetical protein